MTGGKKMRVKVHKEENFRNVQLKEEEEEDEGEGLVEQQEQQYQQQTVLIDSFGRIARKLRISVTDRCNMQCMYCMPHGNVQWFKQKDVLDYNEITRLVSILAGAGIEKLRLTGGEPLLRPKLEDLIISLAKISGIKSISITTNGLLLEKNKAKQLKDAGLGSVNISLDSFKSDRFRKITGIDGVNKVIDAIDAAYNVGLKIKINTVIIRGWNEDEIVDFAKFARTSGHTVRFIEFMPLDGSGIWQPDLVYSKKEMVEIIIKSIGKITPLTNFSNNDKNNNDSNDNDSNNNNNNAYCADPATLYSFDDGKGTIGFIPSITEPFCGNCDRVRLTSDGRLLTCLFEKPGYDLRSMLRSGKSDNYIKKQLVEDVRKKPEGIIKIIKTKTLRPSLNLMHTIGG
ncbi:MAG TPA: GTP 3',8-cyclase MoaA [Nitrososphaeraceae archaeon]